MSSLVSRVFFFLLVLLVFCVLARSYFDSRYTRIDGQGQTWLRKPFVMIMIGDAATRYAQGWRELNKKINKKTAPLYCAQLPISQSKEINVLINKPKALVSVIKVSHHLEARKVFFCQKVQFRYFREGKEKLLRRKESKCDYVTQENFTDERAKANFSFFAFWRENKKTRRVASYQESAPTKEMP